jgi:hypothetical protein
MAADERDRLARDDHGRRQAHAGVAPSLDKAGADGEIGARPWGRSAGGEAGEGVVRAVEASRQSGSGTVTVDKQWKKERRCDTSYLSNGGENISNRLKVKERG